MEVHSEEDHDHHAHEHGDITPSDYATGDILLEYFINLANNGIEFGLTLTVGGLLISGVLTNGAEFYDHLATLVASTDFVALNENDTEPNSPRAEIAEGFRKSGRDYKAHAHENQLNFVHVKQARIYSGGQLVSSGGFWRGRLTAIDGFSVGLIDPNE